MSYGHGTRTLTGTAGGVVTIDLDALRHNYRVLAGLAAPAQCAAVVKADGYGLGVERVASALWAEGCRTFFVAHLGEGLALRSWLPEATIAVLNGLQPGAEACCTQAKLVPVLNSFDQVAAWAEWCRTSERRLPAMVQVDTGMSRLGLSPGEWDRLRRHRDLLAAIDLRFVMSHLACADEPGHPLTAAQTAVMDAMRSDLPGVPVSFANSAGLLAHAATRHDLARPGIALHGVEPVPGQDHGLRAVVRLDARVIQLRAVPAGTAVGYGAAFVTQRPSRIATVAVGYADGWPRHLSNRGAAFVDGIRVPIAGRVSMDSMTLDVTDLPQDRLGWGSAVELIGPHQSVAQVAADAGTIPYEILTSLGHRYERHYIGADATTAASSETS